MKVKELIRLLNELDQEKEIGVERYLFNKGYFVMSEIEINKVTHICMENAENYDYYIE